MNLVSLSKNRIEKEREKVHASRLKIVDAIIHDFVSIKNNPIHSPFASLKHLKNVKKWNCTWMLSYDFDIFIDKASLMLEWVTINSTRKRIRFNSNVPNTSTCDWYRIVVLATFFLKNRVDCYLKLHFTLGVFKCSFFPEKFWIVLNLNHKKEIRKNSRFNDPIIFSYFRVACFKNSLILQLCKIKEYFCMCELKTANYETFAIFKYFCPFSHF